MGTTEIPDKKSYDISELGLSVEAAKNLYTGKVKADIVNRLLENPRFATVTYMIAGYLDDTTAGGYALRPCFNYVPLHQCACARHLEFRREHG